MQVMCRRNVIGVSAMIALGAIQFPVRAVAQQKALKDQLVGMWTLLLADGVTADGTHLPGFGPNPMGILAFGADGRYSLQIMRAVRPKFAASSPAGGTADENKAALQGMMSHFGTYTANDADRTFTLRIEGSSFPNWDDTRHKMLVTAVADDVLTFTDPSPSVAQPDAVKTEYAWRRGK